MGFLDLFKATENKQLRDRINALESQNLFLQQKYIELEALIPKEKKDFDELQQNIFTLNQEISNKNTEKSKIQQDLQSLLNSYNEIKLSLEKNQAELSKIISNVQKLKSLYDQYKIAVKGYEKNSDDSIIDIAPENELMPFVEIDLNCLNIRELRNKYRQNQREIQKVFTKYESRYTTKANSAIYKLMVIAMEAELQNILVTLSNGKLDKAINSIKNITKRYYEVAVEGNQSIAPTMKKFIAEIEFLFIESIKVEYEYYVKKEQEREEQRAIREQMKQEIEEQKALEAEKKKVEREESKYNAQIEQLTEKLQETFDNNQLKQLQERIAQLQVQMEEVKKKKNEIINLQNGKAGYVYVISNLGSFGENVFKVGMTRRQEPMDRIKELSNASVPFSFDVHSLIFSQDAVSLENILHKELNSKRVNKVNLRKEFFKVSIDELENLVMRYDPTAEFKRTMLAEQYHQSMNHKGTISEIKNDNEDDKTVTITPQSVPNIVSKDNKTVSVESLLENINNICQNYVPDYKSQQEENSEFLRIHIYTTSNRKLGIAKIMKSDFSLQFKRTGCDYFDLNIVDDIKSYII